MLSLFLTAAADWLNTFFAEFDNAILTFAHNMYLGSAGEFFRVLLKFFTYLAEDGIAFIVAGVILLCFNKTRRIGGGILLGILVGLLVTNICIKNVIQRPRPYVASEIYNQWWQMSNGVLESEFSFPSGHTTASFAAATGFFVYGNKKYSWTGYVVALIIGFSRNFLMVHYPSDVLGGIIAGTCAGLIGCALVKVIWDFIPGKLGKFIHEFDVIDFIKMLIGKNKQVPQAEAAGEADPVQDEQPQVVETATEAENTVKTPLEETASEKETE